MPRHKDSSIALKPQKKTHASYPLHIHIMLIFTLVLLVAGIVIGFFNYLQTRNSLLIATNQLFTQINDKTKDEMKLVHDMTAKSVTYYARSLLTEYDGFKMRFKALPMMIDTLGINPSIDAIFVAYEDGSLFLVRSLRNKEERKIFKAPDNAVFLAESLDGQDGERKLRFNFYNRDLEIIENKTTDNVKFDPRSRPWFKKAVETKELIQTEPYMFFDTNVVGQTIAKKSDRDNAVVGANIAINTIATSLVQAKPTKYSKIILLDKNKDVVFYSEIPDFFEKNKGKNLSLTNIREKDEELVKNIEEAIEKKGFENITSFKDKNKKWLFEIAPVSKFANTEFYLAIAVPEGELLSGAWEKLNNQIILTLLVILFAMPVAWYLARRLSKDLRTLTSMASSIRQFDFDSNTNLDSSIKEVQDLANNLVYTKKTIKRFLYIDQVISSEKKFNKLLITVLNETLKAVDAIAGTLYLKNEQEEMFYPEATVYISHSNYTDGTRIIDENQVNDVPVITNQEEVDKNINQAIADGVSQIREISADEIPSAYLKKLLENSTVQSLAIPLKNNENKIIGLLRLYRDSDALSPNKDMISFLEKLSGAAAISIENQRLILAQKNLLDALIKLIAGAIDSKSPYTGGHCQRVPVISKMLALAYNEHKVKVGAKPYTDQEWEEMRIGAWLHDCGKVTTPEYVVDKATKLETIFNRIHEVRTRFEVLKRDLEIDYLKALLSGKDQEEERNKLDKEKEILDEEFAFIAECNIGGEFMDDEKLEKIQQIAKRTWQRTISDRLGLSNEEKARYGKIPEAQLPATENVLADKEEHIIERDKQDVILPDNKYGFKMQTPKYKFNLGEITNLSIRRGTLTDEERYKINDHIMQSIIMLAHLPLPEYLKRVPEIACGHHERMDGKGYPRGLKKEQMSREARMMAIADVFEALTASDRPYKKAKPLSDALKIMVNMVKGGHIDPDLFNIFLSEKVYYKYAKNYLSPEQIDEVNLEDMKKQIEPYLDPNFI